MRAIRTWGSVRGVLGDRHPYRDLCGDATRAPTQGPDQVEGGKMLPSTSETVFHYLGRHDRDKSNPRFSDQSKALLQASFSFTKSPSHQIRRSRSASARSSEPYHTPSTSA